MTEAGERSALSFFPEGKTPRPEQIAAIKATEREFASGKTVMALQAPVGSGKSFLAIAHAREVADRGGKTHVVTAQKVLQQQYAEDFPAPLVEIMKGRSNYACDYDSFKYKDASRGYCRSTKKKGLIEECLKYGTVEAAQQFELPPDAHKCAYWKQLQLSLESPITLFNFHSFLFQQRLNRFGKRDLLIIDEAHNTESVLLQFVEISLSDKLLRLVGVKIDLTLKNAKEVAHWIEREDVLKRIKKAVGGEGGEDVPKNLTPTDAEQLNGLVERIEDLLRYLDLTEWVVDAVEEPPLFPGAERIRKLRIRPVFIRPFTKEMLWSKADRVIAMSGTILDPKTWARNLGIPKASFGFVDIPSTFPAGNRPIFRSYAGDMSWKALDSTLPKLYLKITELLARHAGERGIIHGHSERLCRLIRENVPDKRIITLDMFRDRDKDAMLKAHANRPDSVLLASGFHEGVDLKDELARFSIVAKVPWPTTEDKFVKARMEIDGSYLSVQAALKLCQSLGRGIRHVEDHCVNYITDSGFEAFLKRCGWLLPKYFVDAIQPGHK